MSSYYAGYYGSGLRLSEEEYDAFLARYFELNSFTKEKLAQQYSETTDFDDDTETLCDVALNEYGYIISEHVGEDIDLKNQELRFDIARISPDDCDGMRFSPYYYNGKPNTYYVYDSNGNRCINQDYQEFTNYRADTSYMAFSDKSFDSPEVFSKKPYASYETFVEEFKRKFEKYLPADFDWDAHLGRFNYAAYA